MRLLFLNWKSSSNFFFFFTLFKYKIKVKIHSRWFLSSTHLFWDMILETFSKTVFYVLTKDKTQSFMINTETWKWFLSQLQSKVAKSIVITTRINELSFHFRQFSKLFNFLIFCLVLSYNLIRNSFNSVYVRIRYSFLFKNLLLVVMVILINNIILTNFFC